ncbi:MAG: asparagine synthase (glutamine-hydrolyzing) [Phycisphaerales bacterium]|nr:MAG: asparagine synthase (glutamine-hydrolyzing) [Phycisphaerales bacterium]
MCGIVGILSGRPRLDLLERVHEMAGILLHRGPDQQGASGDETLALGMNRLAIVDDRVHDVPYTNEDEGVRLVYNGEVYNHLDIRRRFRQTHSLRNDSDAETVVHAYEEMGLSMLDEFNGMYAFALADYSKRTLYLVRDKVGEKPLYYTVCDGCLYFASEIKAILTQIEPRYNPQCRSYRAFEICCDRETLFEGIYSLLPGEYLEVPFDDISAMRHVRYWLVTDHLIDVPDDDAYIERELTELLEDAVRVRTRNNRHGFGCLVSGGVDSALLVGMARPDYLYTCTYGLGPAYDELAYAQLVADHVGKKLTVVRPTPQEFEAFRSDIIYTLDLPCTWTSFNLFCVLNRVREDCRVTMTGEGIDELFGGYHRYLLLYHDDQIRGIEAMEEYGYLIDKYYGSPVDRYVRLINRCDEPQDPAVRRYLRSTAEPLFDAAGDVTHGMGLVDLYTTMQVLLHMSDRMNMHYSMENRSPFLDPRLVQFAFSMPSRLKIHNGVTKYIIKKIARKFIPREIVERKDKRGFLAPLNAWFGWPTGGKYDRVAYRQLCLEDWRKVFFTGSGDRLRKAPRWRQPVPVSR